MANGDSYNRIAVTKDKMQCGCHWENTKEYGDVLRECPIHKAATQASVIAFEKMRKHSKPSIRN